ncbi:RodZ domain-containing protein [Paenibacillus caui]|uniref:RodZ domain-containing protein n=1 Tax=Paenibacillus caui TaxID=2873927 RepID=UPI001CA846E6|nr:RodZ domain-containing protein [Paenibacillus caui]
MSDLGRQLREARIARGLTLEDVQEMTKIRKRYLEAIEAGDYKVLPGSFYVRAFIKTYAEAVGVSSDELLTEHKKDVPSPDPEPVMEPVLQRRRTKPASENNSKWLSTVLMWAFAVIIVAVIYLVVINSNKGDNNKTADPTPVTSGSAANQTAVPGGSAEASPEPSGSGASANPSESGGTESASPSPSASGDEINSSSLPPVTDGVTVTENGRKGSAAVFDVQSPDNAPVQVQINASGQSWVEVRRGDSSGEKLFFDNTKEGDVLTYDLDSQGLFIKSGASSKTVITVGGQTVEDGRNTSKIQLNLAGAGDSSSSETTTP